MNAILDGVALWLADFHLAAAALLLGVPAALLFMKQPSRRMAVIKATLGALAGLVMLCALPGWSAVHLLTDRPAQRGEVIVDRIEEVPVEQSATQLIPLINVDRIPRPQLDQQAISQLKTAPASQQRTEATNWVWAAMIAQAAGSATVVAWLAAGAVIARRIRRGAVAAPAKLQIALEQIAGPLALPRLLVSNQVSTPVAMGVFDSAIILPAAMTEAGDADPLTPILAHELAHMRNGDLHTLALSRLLLVLLWPQPLYWWLRRSLRLDQEALADAAAAEVAGRVEYAERLVEWARHQDRGLKAPRLAGAVGLWEGPSQLKRRIALLLDEKFAVMRSCSRQWRGACFAAIALAALGLSLVTLQPKSIFAADEDSARAAQVQGNDEKKSTEADATPRKQVDPVALAYGFRSRDDAEPNTFKGRTVDEFDKPLAGVEVTLLRGSLDLVKPRTIVGRATTDASGNYRFANVVDEKREYPSGILTAANSSEDPLYWIVVRKPGRISRESGRGQIELLQQGQANDFVMPPGSLLRGRVTSRDGKPVAGAVVSKSPSLSQFSIWSATTDENGEFEIDDLPPFSASEERKRLEEQRAAVTAQLAAGAGSTLSISMAPQFVVRHPDFAVAKLPTVDIPGRAEAVLEPAGAIVGRVVDDQGRPVAEATVVARVKRDPSRRVEVGSEDFFRSAYETSAQSDERGRFVIPSLFAGQFDLRVETPSLLDPGLPSVDVKAGETTELGDVALDGGVPIKIKFVDAATKQAPDDAETFAAQVAVFLESQVGQWPASPKVIRLDDEGIAEVRALPGRNIVFVQDVRDEKGVRGRPVQQATPVEVRRGETAEVTVRVEAALEVQADRDGGAEKAGASAAATAHRAQGAVTSHSVQGLGTLQSIRLGEAPEGSWPERPNSILVKAVDGEGRPIGGLEAIVYRVSYQEGTHERVAAGATNDQGEVEFGDLVGADDLAAFQQVEANKGLPPHSAGLYLVCLKSPGMATVQVPISRFNVGVYGARREAIMRPAAALRGRVVDEQGGPLAGATVTAGAFGSSISIDGVNAVRTGEDGRFVFENLVAFDQQEAAKREMQKMQGATRASLDFKTDQKGDVVFKPVDAAEETRASELVVRADGFAVTKFRGGDIPGDVEIKLQPAAQIVGRVVEAASGKPAAGLTVIATAMLPPAEGPGAEAESMLYLANTHTARTQTDADGAYRFNGLPAASYDVWAQPEAQSWETAAWVCRGVKGVEAQAAGVATAPELTIGPGAVVRGQLIDGSTGKPLALDGNEAYVRPVQVYDDQMHQYALEQALPVSRDGRFDARVAPGPSRLQVMLILKGNAQGYGPVEYMSRSGNGERGEAFDTRHGETIDRQFVVYSMKAIATHQEDQQKAFKLMHEGKNEEAVAEFDRQIAGDSENGPRYGRSIVLERLGRYTEAAVDLEYLLKTQSHDPMVLNNLASILASAPYEGLLDGSRAVELATHAVAQLRKQPHRAREKSWALGTLAAAYAEVGNFDKAMATQREAISAAAEDDKADFEARLKLYEARRPYRREAPVAKPSSSSSGRLEAKDGTSKTAFTAPAGWWLVRSAVADEDAGSAMDSNAAAGSREVRAPRVPAK